jgi:alcohol dehydrogenase
MLAFVVRNGVLASTTKPIPRLRPGWALVRVRLAGICNTDLEILRGYHNFHRTLGHEFVGEVVRVAEGVAAAKRPPRDRRWLGQRVVGEINIGCAALGRKPLCAFCLRRIVSHCAHRRVLGIIGHDGAFAEYLTLPLANLHAVPASVPDEQAVFTEPLAAACEILEQVRLGAHREAAVLGDGKLAQLIARVLRIAGVRVTMFGRHASKLALARLAGIRTVRLGDAKLTARFRQRYSLLVEATGSPSGFALALEMATPRGTVVLKSTFHGAAEIETWPIVVNELTLIGSRCGPFPRALALLRGNAARGALRSPDLRPLISRVFPLREAAAAMRFAARRGVMKVLLQG